MELVVNCASKTALRRWINKKVVPSPPLSLTWKKWQEIELNPVRLLLVHHDDDGSLTFKMKKIAKKLQKNWIEKVHTFIASAGPCLLSNYHFFLLGRSCLKTLTRLQKVFQKTKLYIQFSMISRFYQTTGQWLSMKMMHYSLKWKELILYPIFKLSVRDFYLFRVCGLISPILTNEVYLRPINVYIKRRTAISGFVRLWAFQQSTKGGLMLALVCYQTDREIYQNSCREYENVCWLLQNLLIFLKNVNIYY